MMDKLDTLCIKTVYQTHMFARMSTRFDHFEYRSFAVLRETGLMPLPGVI